jgi:hypothetical protein
MLIIYLGSDIDVDNRGFDILKVGNVEVDKRSQHQIRFVCRSPHCRIFAIFSAKIAKKYGHSIVPLTNFQIRKFRRVCSSQNRRKTSTDWVLMKLRPILTFALGPQG